MTRRAGLLVVFLAPTPTVAQDAAAALQRAHERYDQIRTLEARFEQVIVNPMLGGPDTTNGVLFLAPPDRFAMRFLVPEGDRIVADGTWLWLYTPSSVDDQVIRMPIPAEGAATPNLFRQFVDDPFSRYHVEYLGTHVGATGAVDRVRLVPQRHGLPFREATIAITTAGLFDQVDFVEESGQRRRLRFSSVLTDRSIADGEFSFEPPPGVRVVTP